jgi:hypothetical protein
MTSNIVHPSGPATSGPNAAPNGSSMWVPVGHGWSPQSTEPARTNTMWGLKWPWRRTTMPGSYSAYSDRYCGSGENASHFSRTKDSVPSALRCARTLRNPMSGSSRWRKIGSLPAILGLVVGGSAMVPP